MKYILVVIIALAGCTVTESEWAQAAKFCEPNGGLKLVHLGSETAVCNNGARFFLR